MLNHQDKVVFERDELQHKVNNLAHFINDSPIFKTLHQEERKMLIEQAIAMANYLNILNLRIHLFSCQASSVKPK
jgi:hypothetical protein